jgi:cytochrome c553
MIGLVALALAAVGFAAGRVLLRPEERVVQPIAFSHATHAEITECVTCHEFFSEREHSGLPNLSVCLVCHEDPQTDGHEEEKIRRLAEAGGYDVFRKLFRLADHAYYSHRRHVSIADIECATCHGGIAETEEPPQRPLVDITMEFCVDCHERDGLESQCTDCHR